MSCTIPFINWFAFNCKHFVFFGKIFSIVQFVLPPFEWLMVKVNIQKHFKSLCWKPMFSKGGYKQKQSISVPFDYVYDNDWNCCTRLGKNFFLVWLTTWFNLESSWKHQQYMGFTTYPRLQNGKDFSGSWLLLEDSVELDTWFNNHSSIGNKVQ